MNPLHLLLLRLKSKEKEVRYQNLQILRQAEAKFESESLLHTWEYVSNKKIEVSTP